MRDFDPLNDGKSKLTLLSFSPEFPDLEIVNDAKASYERSSSYVGFNEIRLLNRLIAGITEPQHTSPLRGVTFKFQVKCPLFVARQWYKHHVASSFVDCQDGWNETSYRYTEAKEEFYIPGCFYTQDKRNKQASAASLDEDLQDYALKQYEVAVENSMSAYKNLIRMGVVREQARSVLPVTIYTTFRWTVSLQALYNFLDLRLGHGAQTEIVKYAICLKDVVHQYVPYTTEAWFNRKHIIAEAMELYGQHKADNETSTDGAVQERPHS